MFVEPDLLGWLTFFEEQEIRADAGVRLKDTVGQPHNRVQVAFLKKVFLQTGLYAFTEESPIWQHDGGTAVTAKNTNNECQKEIRCLTRLEVLREINLDSILFLAAKRWIRQDHIHAVLRAITHVGSGERIRVTHKARVLDAVKEHVGHTEHVRQWLLLDSAKSFLHPLFVSYRFHVFRAHVPD